MTPNATATACRAARRRCLAVMFPVSARKIGTVPGGSMITNSVTKTSASSCQSTVTG